MLNVHYLCSYVLFRTRGSCYTVVSIHPLVGGQQQLRQIQCLYNLDAYLGLQSLDSRHNQRLMCIIYVHTLCFGLVAHVMLQ